MVNFCLFFIINYILIGFVTIEEGEESENSLRLKLRQIGRINFSHDLPVRRVRFLNFNDLKKIIY